MKDDFCDREHRFVSVAQGGSWEGCCLAVLFVPVSHTAVGRHATSDRPRALIDKRHILPVFRTEEGTLTGRLEVPVYQSMGGGCIFTVPREWTRTPIL